MIITPELQLPPDLLRKAHLRGKEYAWRRGDVVAVMRAAGERGLAPQGGEAQFRLPRGISEVNGARVSIPGGCFGLYWRAFGCTGRSPNEPWPDFVARSTEQCIAAFERLCEGTDFVAEGLRTFPSLGMAAQRQQLDLEQHLYFALTFLQQADSYQP